ncbi:16S rRNA (adenine(1518)-N(6)/adenine(1519)-N(6))-dimethyltransferase RsmA [Gynuella sunshinyii]|uniref:Ribosomal RNA small subunit methyltransferase A n=1 Tax=Gynuella sunshinyii YC6258 TaxID=1445510 RepID=A0A0C5V430_9GAMM|nr:16S rRNA (adenine(1518)-N(6)/adenine(1519)-N(6))-dimethyltransferase RsmA [Gynuella sunshinyii]AJQ94225.1 dimethyladenosine transferase (rRNA methylation) [Gynuella sunshinyii YC6258]
MHKARKRFGQNFLHDQQIIDRIVSAIHPKPDQHLVEIGPGQGALTEQLLAATDGQLDVIELDRDLIPILQVKFFSAKALTIHEADALKFDFASLYPGEPLRVVGNLPYNISTPLLFHLLRFTDHITDMHFMLQKEVVERICASPGGSDYGRLSVMMQYFCQTEYLFTVKPGAFNPAPKVDSAIIRLAPRPKHELTAHSLETLETVVRTSFSQRRKTLRNNLKQLMTLQQIEDTGIDPGIRPERLSVADFVNLANLLTPHD